jgi:hypothetical protein
MAADVQIHEMSGAAAGTDKTGGTVMFKSADEIASDESSNPIAVPSAGSDYSYTKQLRFYLNSAPAGSIENLRAYSDGAGFGTGIGCQFDVSGSWAANIDTDISGEDVFGKDSGDPIDMDSNNTGPHTGTGYKGDFLRLQLVVSYNASTGFLDAETLTFAYDET